MKTILLAFFCGVFSSAGWSQSQPNFLEKFVQSVQKMMPSPHWDPLLKKIPQWDNPNSQNFPKLSLTRSPLWTQILANPKTAPLKKEDIDRLGLEISQLSGAERVLWQPLAGWLYFEKRWYPESLQVVHQLTQVHPEMAVLYDAIQAIYGAQQKAGGNTALQAL